MIDKLIKFLGGSTSREYYLLNLEYSNQRDLVNLYRAREERLEGELKAEREERKFLQDLIFKRFGVVVPEDKPSQEESFQPIKTSPKRWSELKGAMERDDRMRINSQDDRMRTNENTERIYSQEN